MTASKIPLIVVVGETASGKSSLGMELAEKFDGEIICADSRTVYKGMDIGTAKPTIEERARVKHHLIDVVEPNQSFNVAQFKTLALEAIADISRRGKVPIMVGGSGLYIDSVLFNYSFADIQSKKDEQNPRHLASSVRVRKEPIRRDTLVVGLNLPRESLKERISRRVSDMVGGGFVKEVSRLEKEYGQTPRAFLAPGYKAFLAYLNGSLTLEEAKDTFIKGDIALAKKQRTWFKRNKYIQWSHDPSELVALATTFLNNYK